MDFSQSLVSLSANGVPSAKARFSTPLSFLTYWAVSRSTASRASAWRPPRASSAWAVSRERSSQNRNWEMRSSLDWTAFSNSRLPMRFSIADFTAPSGAGIMVCPFSAGGGASTCSQAKSRRSV